MELVIGTKQWSSWSMRPWLVLRHANIAFDETVVELRLGEATEAAIDAAGSPNGRVPILKDGELTVWDSLAICEYLNDRHPEAQLWPEDRHVRALARSASAEMHSGFASLRGECPMDLSMRKDSAELSMPTHVDIRRIVALWNAMRERSSAQGEFLFGPWSIADAYFTPVATRFRTYGVRLSEYGDRGEAAVYCETLLQTDEFKLWDEQAKVEAPTT